MVPFSEALYYPSSDIKDEMWLKNALLYWDRVYTIVPESVTQPYSKRTAQAFRNAGLLEPVHMQSSKPVVQQLSDDVMNYLTHPDSMGVLTRRNNSAYDRIHISKLPREVVELIEDQSPDHAHNQAENTARLILEGDWAKVDKPFANYYMTLLATRLANKEGYGLLTNASVFDRLAVAAKMDATINVFDQRHFRSMPKSLAQGILANFTFEGFRIGPETSVKKILNFIRDHKDERGRFREEVAKLTEAISNCESPEQLGQQVQNIYTNQVTPAMNSLKEALKAHGIQSAAKGLLNIGTFSVPPAGIIVLLHLASPLALLAGLGVSVAVSTIEYNTKKDNLLRSNPYSYVLSMENTFPKLKD